MTCDFSPEGRPGFEEPTIFLRERYRKAVELSGGVPILLAPLKSPSEIRRALEAVDALLLTGSGPDIDPGSYGEKQILPLTLMVPERLAMERKAIQIALDQDMPLFGICGGAQMLAVATGGSLYQDIPSQISSPLRHGRGDEMPTHDLALNPKTLLKRIVGRSRIRVNSSHHQAVKETGTLLRVSARSDDGIIEALESPSHRFVLGVQWHPEYGVLEGEEISRKIFAAFIEASRGRLPGERRR